MKAKSILFGIIMLNILYLIKAGGVPPCATMSSRANCQTAQNCRWKQNLVDIGLSTGCLDYPCAGRQQCRCTHITGGMTPDGFTTTCSWNYILNVCQ